MSYIENEYYPIEMLGGPQDGKVVKCVYKTKYLQFPILKKTTEIDGLTSMPRCKYIIDWKKGMAYYVRTVC